MIKLLYAVVHVVSKSTGPTVVGIYTDKNVAERIRVVTGFSAVVREVEIDYIHPGHRTAVKEIYGEIL